MRRFAVVMTLFFLFLCAFLFQPAGMDTAAESGDARVPTLKGMLETALQPVGSTMYIWGGGWNKEDTAAGKDALRIGVNPKWKRFADRQDASYDYQNYRYRHGFGLDCSGYIGWVVYNTIPDPSPSGYVTSARKQGFFLSEQGFGAYRHRKRVTDYRAGDIMSSECSCCDHVWMVVGACKDGSVVLVHSSPPGVRLCGTPDRRGRQKSQAVRLATHYMKRYYRDWYDRYPSCSKDSSYLSHYGQMRWKLDGSVMTDPDGYRNLSAKKILKDLYRHGIPFGEK